MQHGESAKKKALSASNLAINTKIPGVSYWDTRFNYISFIYFSTRSLMILTEKRADAFTISLHKRLLDRDTYSVDAAIALTLDEYRSQMMTPYVNPKPLTFAVVLLSMFGFIAWYIFAVAYKTPKVSEEFKKAQPCELTTVYQEPCNYCGGIFIIGMHTTCPHCGAALPAHHYIKDEQGNVVQIL